MNERRIDLSEDEEILFESGPAVLTNRRLVGNLGGAAPGDSWGEVLLKDVASFKKMSGGQESRLKLGLQSTGIGAVLVLLEILIQDLPTILENILFLAGALAVLVGAYLSMSSLFRVKPHTSVLFVIPGEKDAAVAFPGRDNPEADELTRRFVRAKRGL